MSFPATASSRFAPLFFACCLSMGACGGDSTTIAPPPPPVSVCGGAPAATRSTESIPYHVSVMFNQVWSCVSGSLAANQDAMARNPRWATQIQAKIEMLQNPTLGSQIVDGRMYVAEGLDSRVPVVAVFPAESMRADAARAVHEVVLALPVLEEFMSMLYQVDHVYIWYGFVVGSSGGGGTLQMEDEGCYEERAATGLFVAYPYEAMIDHEVSHGFIAHESSNQFLEVYAHNMVHVGSSDFPSWTYRRSYAGVSDANTGVNALLDIYQWLGRDLMEQAYRRLQALHPPYGQPLSAECQQVFVDVAPDALKAQVAAAAARIGY